jgi:2,3-diketo-5-methylthio-1-phosphopentane phosphatase
MKKFIFVSDFDGTLTGIDFYQILLDKYLGKRELEYFYRWKSGEINVFSFLKEIFTAIDLSKDELLEDIKSITFDKSSINFIKKVRQNGGDFIVLSAGASYYIEKLFDYHGISDINVIANKSCYKDGKILLTTKETDKYYSNISGIDKAKVVSDLRNKYEKLYYAGDGEPDYLAAVKADYIYAKLDLKDILENKKINYKEFKTFFDIEKDLFKV